MPDNVTEERTQLLKMYGAEIVYSEGAKGSNGAVEVALDMAEKNPSYYMPYQYGNPANPNAHYTGTAPEIHEELGNIAAFVAGLGTGGTLMGCARYFKEHDPNARSSRPSRSRANSSKACARSTMGSSRRSSTSLCSTARSSCPTVTLSSGPRNCSKKRAASPASRAEDLRCRGSAAEKIEEGNVVFVIADDGWKYLSSGVYTKTIEELEADGSLESTLFW